MKFETGQNNWDDLSMNQNMQSQGGCCCQPIYECPEEKVCHRYMCYEVPHIKPCNTRIINHHIYKHTFEPCHTCCEENVVENIFERKCNF